MLTYTELVRHAGNEPLCQAVELSALGLLKGYPLHIHAEGLRGTGKTTVMRSARGLLPRILRVRDCRYNCDPQAPHCPEHRGLNPAEVLRVGTEWIPVPFLEISPSAKIGTVVGSIDLGRLAASERPEAAILPGTLAQAHRGIVFVDEINRLADIAPELADALLDVMGTKPGRLQIEETGLPRIELSCQVTVWAASNPDEEPGPLADIRRQLSDRFDLVAAMRRPSEPQQVAHVLDRDDFAVRAAARPAPLDALRRSLRARAGQAVPPAGTPVRELLAHVYCSFQLESLRAVQAWQAAARLEALRLGAAAVEPEHLRAVAPQVLRHRLEAEELARVLDFLEHGERAEAREMAGAASVARAAAGGARAMAAMAGLGAEAALAAGRQPHGWQEIWDRLRGALAGGQGQPGDGSPAGGGGCATGAAADALPAGVAGAAATASNRLADPAQLPPFAPGVRARYLADLDEHEMLRFSQSGGGSA